MKAPENIQIATIETLQWAMIYCRNYSLISDANMEQVNELMEAIHDIQVHCLDGQMERSKP